MMNKKKAYCIVSFVLAVIVFAAVMVLVSTDNQVYAASNEQDALTDMQFTDDEGMMDTSGRRSDGFSMTYNNESGSISTPIKSLLVLTILALAPSILIMMTSYTRIIIVLHFVRVAIGTQTSPPNQVLIGLALFLTFFIMWPTFQTINENAIQPLDNGDITLEEAMEEAVIPIREFMGNQTQAKDLTVFFDISGEYYDLSEEGAIYEIPMTMLIPAFILTELRYAFIMGFLIYVPFIVIDMVVASVLMSMGMMMLPPTTISIPFKILLFILVDGWEFLIESLVRTFY